MFHIIPTPFQDHGLHQTPPTQCPPPLFLTSISINPFPKLLRLFNQCLPSPPPPSYFFYIKFLFTLQSLTHPHPPFFLFYLFFMPPKELWEAYSNRTVRPSVRPSVSPSVRQSVRPAFVSGPYLLYSLR